MLKAPKHSDSLLTFRILPSFHPTPKGVGFPARKFCNIPAIILIRYCFFQFIYLENDSPI